jgi:endonuclease IV
MFGPHVSRVHAYSKKASIAKHIAAARTQAAKESFDIKAVSVFVAGPRTRAMVMTDKEASELKSFLEETKIRVIAHGAYAGYPWKGDPSAARFVRLESAMCFKAGIQGLVVHLPNHPPSVVAKYLARLYTGQNTRIYLETPAVSPESSHYETPKKLAALFKEVRKIDPALHYTGLCIDTAHIWSCGADISSYEAAEKWFTELEAFSDVIPHDRIMLHLNDSDYEKGDGRDKHAVLLKGKIWSAYKDSPAKSGLAAVVDYVNRHGTPTILERNDKDDLRADYRTLHSLTESVRLPATDE